MKPVFFDHRPKFFRKKFSISVRMSENIG